MKKVGFISLGCPKNLVDSEVMMGRLKQDGYEITGDAAEAETLVVNTCGFIDAAKKESVEAILEAARLKSEGKCKRLVVAGCLVERYRDELRAEIPEVDAFIGTSQINDINTAADARVNTRSLPVLPLGNQTATYLYDESTPRVLATPGHFAYVKIAEGCDRPCAFCFIPQMRGHFRSRRFGSVIAEAQQLAAQGVKEIILVAQDSSRYGEDLGEQDALAHLMRELCRLDGVEWVRVMYTYPTHISDAFLDALAEEPKAVKYLDMPLQHASQNVLKLMKRGGNRQSLERLIERVRARVPGIAVRTTFITGFPGETEEDFEELRAFVRSVGFDRVGVFTYSDEEGTPAFELPDKVDARTARRRRTQLMKDQSRISLRKNRARVGSVVRVLFEGASEETDLLWQGRAESQAPEIDGCVLINDAPEGCAPEPGDFVQVEITEAQEYDLVGRIIADREEGDERHA
ncbi:MAG TPA: 30S ribosomal protein S12 methylthiotransferase RimO [Pyrinomonadaceae bacterium]|jgi:ribosomal protein S12 methylthiotransferase|nr:30S ribosomal protein S12 methylthiotransferase RimO [Pyrinomonadaceae bacterium]